MPLKKDIRAKNKETAKRKFQGWYPDLVLVDIRVAEPASKHRMGLYRGVWEYKKHNVAPRGWVKTKGASNPPGYEWYNNGESRFSGKRKVMLVKKK